MPILIGLVAIVVACWAIAKLTRLARTPARTEAVHALATQPGDGEVAEPESEAAGAGRHQSEEHTLAEGLAAPLFIRYRDAHGYTTERTVQVNQAFGDGPGSAVTHIRGICESRKAIRTFRTDRIELAAHPHTGEVIADLGLYLIGRPSPAPTQLEPGPESVRATSSIRHERNRRSGEVTTVLEIKLPDLSRPAAPLQAETEIANPTVNSIPDYHILRSRKEIVLHYQVAAGSITERKVGIERLFSDTDRPPITHFRGYCFSLGHQATFARARVLSAFDPKTMQTIDLDEALLKRRKGAKPFQFERTPNGLRGEVAE